MPQFQRWSILLITSDSSHRVHRLPLSRRALFFVGLFVVLGVAGLVRGVSLYGGYAWSSVSISQEFTQNHRLSEMLGFLHKFSENYGTRVSSLIDFEDKTRIRYGLNPIDPEIRKAGIGGLPTAEDLATASLTDPMLVKADTIRVQIQSLSRQIEMQQSTFLRMTTQVLRQYDYYAQRPAVWPMLGGRITSSFGSRVSPILERTMFHEGIDIANPLWTPIYATADGIVSQAGLKSGFGNLVIIEHGGSGYETFYAHMSKVAVSDGQPVKRGELVGYLGSTGWSTGPHLHYEVHKFNKPVNPMDFILPLDIMVD